MTKELGKISTVLKKIFRQEVSVVSIDKESALYDGCDFKVDNLKFKFRKSKITPKKAGQFVTLWKRNTQNETEPFHEYDDFDYCIIAAVEDKKFGFFIFSKRVLMEKGIISTTTEFGKRGFRVYPIWSKTENKQAIKSQAWQTKYFINLVNDEKEIINNIMAVLKDSDSPNLK